jgi:histidinol-phosphatase
LSGAAGSATFGADWSASLRRGPESELRAWLDFALTLSDEADGMALAGFQREMEITTKPDRTLVTQVDQAIETRLRERIAAAYPEHGVLGEEQGQTQPDAAVRWYIDPIDGTHNFVRGVPLFGTLLGVERDGEMQVGVLSAPALRERWFAWRGGGAWVLRAGPVGAPEPRRIEASGVRALADAQILYGSPFDIMDTGWAPGFPGMIRGAWRDRGFGDFWGYTLVAEGAAEAMLEVGIHPWDLAAPLVLIEEAGGRMSDFGGARRVDAGSVVATNGILHAAVLAALRDPTRHGDERSGPVDRPAPRAT